MNREIVLAEWRRARQSLRTAQVLTAEQCPEDAVSRAYHAILHGAKAARHMHDVAVASHAGARRMAAEITAGHASQVDLPVAVHGSVANLRDFMEYREARRAQQTRLDFSVFLPLARGDETMKRLSVSLRAPRAVLLNLVRRLACHAPGC